MKTLGTAIVLVLIFAVVAPLSASFGAVVLAGGRSFWPCFVSAGIAIGIVFFVSWIAQGDE